MGAPFPDAALLSIPPLVLLLLLLLPLLCAPSTMQCLPANTPLHLPPAQDINLPRPDKYQTAQLVAFLQQLLIH